MYRGGMPRTKGDHEARRRDVSAAVWQVMATRGFAGLTLRAVAAELGATTGLLTHYFPAKRDLVAYALDLLEQRTRSRPRRRCGQGLAAFRDALLDILPLTPEATDSNRVWVSSWDAALSDPALAADYARKYAESRDRLRARVAAAQELGELPPGDPARIAAGAQSFVLGLVVQALFDPAEFTPRRQVELLDGYVAALATGNGPAPPPGDGAGPRCESGRAVSAEVPGEGSAVVGGDGEHHDHEHDVGHSEAEGPLGHGRSGLPQRHGAEDDRERAQDDRQDE